MFRIIKKVAYRIVSRLRDNIKYSQTEAEWRVVRQTYYDTTKISDIGGCIDCKNIKIQNPRGPKGEIFRNRIGCFSLNVQVNITYSKNNNILFIQLLSD